MSTFRKPQNVHLPAEAVARARTFAEAVTGTVNYRDSNQTQKKKIEDDHFVSKLGEEAVRLVFEIRHCLVAFEDRKPDFECVVYPLRKIKQLIFEPPKLKHLAGKKKTVSMETLQKNKVF